MIWIESSLEHHSNTVKLLQAEEEQQFSLLLGKLNENREFLCKIAIS